MINAHQCFTFMGYTGLNTSQVSTVDGGSLGCPTLANFNDPRLILFFWGGLRIGFLDIYWRTISQIITTVHVNAFPCGKLQKRNNVHVNSSLTVFGGASSCCHSTKSCSFTRTVNDNLCGLCICSCHVTNFWYAYSLKPVVVGPTQP